MNLNYPLLVDIYETLLMVSKQKFVKSYNQYSLNVILQEDVKQRYRLWLLSGSPILVHQELSKWIWIMNTFEELNQPQEVNQYGDTALIWACLNRVDQVVILQLIDQFGELCRPEHVN